MNNTYLSKKIWLYQFNNFLSGKLLNVLYCNNENYPYKLINSDVKKGKCRECFKNTILLEYAACAYTLLSNFNICCTKFICFDGCEFTCFKCKCKYYDIFKVYKKRNKEKFICKLCLTHDTHDNIIESSNNIVKTSNNIVETSNNIVETPIRWVGLSVGEYKKKYKW